VVLLHSWFGLTDHFRGLCTRLAEASFSAVAPDLYGGPQTDDPARAKELRKALRDDEVLERISVAVDQAQLLAGDKPVGLVGFSVGGEFAIRTGAARGKDIAAVTTFYGLYVPEDLAGLEAPVQAHLAGDDEFVEPDEAGEFVERSMTLGKSLELYTYPGTRHAFSNATRPESYDAVAADLAWRRTREFLTRHLVG
jgi:carboxymethylenebutenolidase